MVYRDEDVGTPEEQAYFEDVMQAVPRSETLSVIGCMELGKTYASVFIHGSDCPTAWTTMSATELRFFADALRKRAEELDQWVDRHPRPKGVRHD